MIKITQTPQTHIALARLGRNISRPYRWYECEVRFSPFFSRLFLNASARFTGCG
jgi:hypothetical protein